MKDIILPSESADAIDLGAITEDTRGVIIAYKDKEAIGFIAKDSSCDSPWGLFDGLDVDVYTVSDAQDKYYYSDTLVELVTRLIKEKIANNFKLIDFKIIPNKSDNKNIVNKNCVWS